MTQHIGVFTIAVGLGESLPGSDVCAKQRDRMEALARLMFDNIETVDFTIVQPEPEQQIYGYHVTGQVTIVCGVNKYIEAKDPQEAKQKFIQSAKKGIYVKVDEGHALDFVDDGEDELDISVSDDIDVMISEE